MKKRRRRILGGLPWFSSPTLALNGVLPSRIDDFVGARYYNSSSGVTAFPFTSTRTTNATMFDSSGDLVFGPANMCLQTSTFTSASWSKSRVTTPDAETIRSDATATNTHYINQAITKITGAVRVSFEVELKADGLNYAHIRVCESANFNTQHGSTYIDLANGALLASSQAGTYSVVDRTITNAGSGWYRVRLTVLTNTATGMGVFIFLSQDGTSTIFSGDSVSGVKARKCRVAYGQILDQDNTTTASYGPRINYNPATLAVRGLRSEEARTNDIPTSIPSAGTATTISTGGTYSTQFVAARGTADGTAAAHSVNAGSITPGATQARRINAIVKAVGGTTRIQMSVSLNHGIATDYANFNISTGSVLATGATASNAAIVSLGNGWWRLGLTYTTIGVPAAGDAVNLFFITADGDTRAPVNSSTDAIDVVFCESAATSGGDTSVVPTFGAAVTKGQDTFSLTTGSWLSQSVGTLYMSFYPGNSVSGERWYALISDGTSANLYGVTRTTSDTHRCHTFLASVVTTGPTSALASTDFAASKVAGVFNSPTRKICLNGGTVASSSAAFPTSGLTTLRLGISTSTNNHIDGDIAEFRYYPDGSATDPQLQTLTT